LPRYDPQTARFCVLFENELPIESILFYLFFFYAAVNHRYLHSFPTRRSSDLKIPRFGRSLLENGRSGNRRFQISQESTRFGVFEDRKSTRLNSSHVAISYAVFCLKKKKS